MLEKDIEKKLVAEVVKRGGVCWKFTSSINGVPDRIILLPGGEVMFVETKAPGGKPRPIQMARIRKIKELGVRAEVISSKEEIEKLFEKEEPNEIQTT